MATANQRTARLALLVGVALAGCSAGPSATTAGAWTMPMASGAASGSGAPAGVADRSAAPRLRAGAGDGIFDQFPPLGPDGHPLDPGRGTENEDEDPWPAFDPGYAGVGPRWWTDEATAAIAARRLGRGMVVDFWASWCPGCRVLDATTLSDPSVRAALEGWFVPVKLDVSEDTAPNKARLSLRRVYSLPAILILDARGVEIDRLGSYLPPDDFLAWLVAARARMPDAVQEQRTAAH